MVYPSVARAVRRSLLIALLAATPCIGMGIGGAYISHVPAPHISVGGGR